MLAQTLFQDYSAACCSPNNCAKSASDGASNTSGCCNEQLAFGLESFSNLPQYLLHLPRCDCWKIFAPLWSIRDRVGMSSEVREATTKKQKIFCYLVFESEEENLPLERNSWEHWQLHLAIHWRGTHSVDRFHNFGKHFPLWISRPKLGRFR